MKRRDVQMAENLLGRGNDHAAVARALRVSEDVLGHCLELAQDKTRRRGEPTDEERQAAVAYESGKSLAQVAHDFRRSIWWVSAALRRTNTAVRPKGSASNVDRIAEIVRRFDAGETATEIAEVMDVSPERIRQVLVKAGRKRGRVNTQQMLRERRDRTFRADYEAGLTVPEIAQKRGISVSTVTAGLRRQGVNTKRSYISAKTLEALRLFDEGVPIEEITTNLGYKNRACCRALLHKYGRTGQRRVVLRDEAA